MESIMALEESTLVDGPAAVVFVTTDCVLQEARSTTIAVIAIHHLFIQLAVGDFFVNVG